jgi:hypothetical protein
MKYDILQQAEQLLLAVKMQQSTSDLVKALAEGVTTTLLEQLDTDTKKKTFWINIYNAYYQILRQAGHIKPQIYRSRLFVIAGKQYSLDDVEHGILRKNKFKYGLGLLPSLFVVPRLKKLAVDKVDYRIHFALNCGAVSCPPIAFYKSSNLEAQLDMATQSFLEAETEWDEVKKIVGVTALFKWFYADFGGEAGIRKIYKQQLDQDLTGFTIRYREYSWEDDLSNFSE